MGGARGRGRGWAELPHAAAVAPAASVFHSLRRGTTRYAPGRCAAMSRERIQREHGPSRRLRSISLSQSENSSLTQRVKKLGLPPRLLEPLGDDAEVLEVHLEELPQPRALHLHNHLAAVHSRAVHLPERGGGDGRAVEVVEHLVHGGAELVFDDLDSLREGEAVDERCKRLASWAVRGVTACDLVNGAVGWWGSEDLLRARLVGGEGRHAVLELLELLDELGREDVHAGGELRREALRGREGVSVRKRVLHFRPSTALQVGECYNSTDALQLM